VPGIGEDWSEWRLEWGGGGAGGGCGRVEADLWWGKEGG